MRSFLRNALRCLQYGFSVISALAFVEVYHFPLYKFQLWTISGVFFLLSLILKRLRLGKQKNQTLIAVFGKQRQVIQLYSVPDAKSSKRLSALPPLQQLTVLLFFVTTVNSYWQVVRTNIPLSKGGSADSWFDAALISGLFLMIQLGVFDQFLQRPEWIRPKPFQDRN